MVIETPRNQEQYAGLASQWSDTVTGGHEHLYLSDSPMPVIVDWPFALDQTVPIYTPLMWNEAATALVPATQGTPAVAINLKEMVVGDTGEMPGSPVVIQAKLNMAALSWDDSYATDAQKFNAFRGAETPTSIIVGTVYRGAVVAQP